MTLVVPFDDIFKNESGLLSRHFSWERVELGEVCSILNGYALKSSLFNSTDGFPVIRIRDLARNRTATYYKGVCPPEYIINNGDLLISMDGLFGCYEWTGGQAYLNQRVCRIASNERFLNNKFLLFALNGYLKAIEEATSSVTVGHLSSRDILRIPFPLPPLDEQWRIVEKVEKLLGKFDACQKRLEKIPLILKRFRQSVLSAACSGRLTTNWRKSEEEEAELPAGWRWVLLEDLLPKGGIFDGPFGSNLKTSDYTASGVRVIRLENIGHLTFYNAKETYISPEKYEALTKHTVGCGDIIFSSFIADEIRVCALPQLTTKAIAKADCFCLRPMTDLVDRTFLTFQLVSRESYNALVESVHGATRPRINTTQLRRLKIRMCPLQEQQEIVRRVEALFKFADQIEARYNKAKAYVDKLAQSILAKAFRGELVEQDPNDEPASVLLERIRGQRASSEPTNKKARPLSR